MRKQIVRIAVMTVSMTACMTISALATGWKTDNSGRWYENRDGSYPRNQWQWIDNDGDGMSECYYPSLPLGKTEMEPWWAPFCCKYTVFPVFIRLEVI